MIYKNHLLIFILLLTLMLQTVMAQDNSKGKVKQDKRQENTNTILETPAGVGNQLMEDEFIRKKSRDRNYIDDALKPWFDFKSHLKEKYGLNLGIDYTALFQRSSNDTGENIAAGGIFSIFGKWTLLGRKSNNTGSLIFLIENRHRLGTDIAPQLLGPEAGYLGSTGSLFIDVRCRIWRSGLAAALTRWSWHALSDPRSL